MDNFPKKPDLSHLSHPEQVIRASIWNYPSLFGPQYKRKKIEVPQISEETRALIKEMWENPEPAEPHVYEIPKQFRDRSKYLEDEEIPGAGRGAVLHHLFCVNGNGYDWHEGRLVVISHPYTKTTWTDEEGVVYTEREYDYDTILTGEEIELDDADYVKEFSIRNTLEIIGEDDWETFESFDPEVKEEALQRAKIYCLEEKRDARERLEELANASSLKGRASYPMSKGYCMLDSIPDNITDEWLDLAEEAAKMVLASTIIPSYGTQDTLDQNHNIARKALKRIEKLRLERC